MDNTKIYKFFKMSNFKHNIDKKRGYPTSLWTAPFRYMFYKVTNLRLY